MVRKNKRKLSPLEYEFSFRDLYRFSAERTGKVAKRKKKWITNNIDNAMNEIYCNIMELYEGYFEEKSAKADLAFLTVKQLYDLQRPLFILWNVEMYQTKRMVRWVDLINRCITLLNMKVEEERRLPYKVMILDWNVIDSVHFLSNMSELHRYVHGKVIHAPNKYDDTEGALMVKLIDDAFWCLIQANQKVPETKSEFKKRKENISKAISCLHKVERPMIFYFNLMQYSESIMVEWSDMLKEELKLLYGVVKSDKQRFSELLD